MKPLQNQYQDLLEGKMSKFNFLNNIKRNLPDLVSNITSFDDAVKILKNKRILSEVKSLVKESIELEDIVSKYVKDPNDIEKEMEQYHNHGFQGFSDMLQANLDRDSDFQSWVQKGHDEETYKKETGYTDEYDEFQQDRERHLPEDKQVNEDWGGSDQYAMNKSIHRDLGEPTEKPSEEELRNAAESAVDFFWDEWEEYQDNRDGLIEKAIEYYLRKYFPESEQDQAIIKQYSDEEDAKHAIPGMKQVYAEGVDIPANLISDIDKVNPIEYRNGIDYELDLSGDFSAESLEKCAKKVVKNLKKNPIYYTSLKAEVTSKINKKTTEATKSVEIKKDNHIDKLNNLKTLVKKELANTKISLSKQEKASKATPKGVKLMKEDRDVEARYQEYVGKLNHGNKANIEKQWKDAGEDMVKKHKVVVRAKELSEIKEYLTKQLKKEMIDPQGIIAAKAKGEVINVPKEDKQGQEAVKKAKGNFTTY